MCFWLFLRSLRCVFSVLPVRCQRYAFCALCACGIFLLLVRRCEIWHLLSCGESLFRNLIFCLVERMLKRLLFMHLQFSLYYMLALKCRSRSAMLLSASQGIVHCSRHCQVCRQNSYSIPKRFWCSDFRVLAIAGTVFWRFSAFGVSLYLNRASLTEPLLLIPQGEFWPACVAPKQCHYENFRSVRLGCWLKEWHLIRKLSHSRQYGIQDAGPWNDISIICCYRVVGTECRMLVHRQTLDAIFNTI